MPWAIAKFSESFRPKMWSWHWQHTTHGTLFVYSSIQFTTICLDMGVHLSRIKAFSQGFSNTNFTRLLFPKYVLPGEIKSLTFSLYFRAAAHTLFTSPNESLESIFYMHHSCANTQVHKCFILFWKTTVEGFLGWMQAGGEIAAHFTCVSEWPAHSRLIASTAFRSSLKGLRLMRLH